MILLPTAKFDINAIKKAGLAKQIDMSSQMFRDYHLQQPRLDIDHIERRDGRYRLSPAEQDMLQSYAIQFFGLDDDNLEVRMVYPYPMCAREAEMRGFVPEMERSTNAFVVWNVSDAEGEGGDIETEIGLWDERLRIRWLWHGHSDDNRMDPADVLSDGEEKWVHVHEVKDQGDKNYKYTRDIRTTYGMAGGKELDTRNQHDACNRLTQWHREFRYHLDIETYNIGVGPQFSTTSPRGKQSVYYGRQSIDRAHADEMLGPAYSDENN